MMTVVGGAFGAFLGYAGFETATSTLVGLFAGCVGGALLMLVCWAHHPPGGCAFRSRATAVAVVDGRDCWDGCVACGLPRQTRDRSPSIWFQG